MPFGIGKDGHLDPARFEYGHEAFRAIRNRAIESCGNIRSVEAHRPVTRPRCDVAPILVLHQQQVWPAFLARQTQDMLEEIRLIESHDDGEAKSGAIE